jgi:hypothetical protein
MVDFRRSRRKANQFRAKEGIEKLIAALIKTMRHGPNGYNPVETDFPQRFGHRTKDCAIFHCIIPANEISMETNNYL